ncbi:MAG: NUDIX domain-containing protein [Candidatus Shapirobacteria bacterium]|nr:NUDIX domain-containing protein [Candidatus Shapirobacteria bacterium]
MKKTVTKFPRGVEVVGGAVIENNQGKLLLTKSSKWNNKWVWPGGHIEPGETIIDGVKREIEEEVGLTVEPIGILAWGETIDNKNFHRPSHFVYFHVHFKALDDKITLDNLELQEYKWVTPQEALTMDIEVSCTKTIKKFMKFSKKKNK